MNEGHEAAPARPGLRERKKQRTREALVRAAIELFVSQGYEETTVDEIAAAVDVSQRTFFRYFAGKEEAALAVQDMVEWHFVAALRERPAEEPPLEALRRAVIDSWDTIGEAIEDIIPVELHMRACQLIESTPTLLAAHLRHSTELEEQVAHVIADREGLDMDADPRPRIAVAAFSGVMRMTARLWGAGEDTSVESIRALTVSYLDRVGVTLADSWHPHAAGTPKHTPAKQTPGTGRAHPRHAGARADGQQG